MARFIAIFVALAVLFAAPVKVFSAEEKGQLDKFEDELDSKKDKKEISDAHSSSATDSVGASVIETLLGIFATSLFEMADEKDMHGVYKYLKKEEIPALPTFKLDGNYQYVAGGINSFDIHTEAGYLMFGVDGEYKRFYENSPNDTLNMANFHILVRALFGEIFQINLALGEKFVWGDTRHQGVELGFPFYVIFGKYFFWDVKPYMAFVGQEKIIYDIASGLNVKYKFAGFRAGYRYIKVDSQNLRGPEVGLFIQF